MKSKIQKIINVSHAYLDSINIDKYQYLANINNEYYNYMKSKSGIEHYRLLTFISSIFDNEILLDVGTNRGFSAIALADNKTNSVISYDIEEYSTIEKIKLLPAFNNISFKLGNFLNMENLHEIKFIMLDTAHDGFFEEQVVNHLKSIKWKGLLLMDDINHTFIKLNQVWQSIDLEKHDLTKTGHYSGTGMVVFE
jgi:predicted nicotinamide N-methyase